LTRLSVNINKIALLRNSRGHRIPDPVQVALDCERFGADGITVHPRPDGRHIRAGDVRQLKNCLNTELNIEGNPLDPGFMELVLEVRPTQATLVPDAPAQLTSDHGWDFASQGALLQPRIQELVAAGIRVSLFVDPVPEHARLAGLTGAHAVELYTEAYARAMETRSANSEEAPQILEPYLQTARAARELGLRVHAGHDLNLHNLPALSQAIPWLHEVSIGHALVADALYLGLENTVGLYRRCLTPKSLQPGHQGPESVPS